MKLTIAIPSFQRPNRLRLLLESLPPRIAEVAGADIDVLVIDNDAAGSAREAFSGASHRPRYVIESTPGIAAARNRALDECAESDLLAFIDDDELPREGWLSSLVSTWREHRSSAVMGMVVSVFDENVDPWVLATGTFRRLSHPTGTRLAVAAAGNLLLDLRQVRELGVRFDEALGLGGGEDTLFSRQLVARGGTIAWCGESVAEDLVIASRVTRHWALQRAFSSGNAGARVILILTTGALRRGTLRAQFVVTGAARMAVGALRHLFGRLSGNLHHNARGIRQLHRGRGIIAAAFGHRHDEYGRTANTMPQ